MPTTIVLTTGADTTTFKISDAKMAEIIAAMDLTLERDPEDVGTDLRNFDYFAFYLVEWIRKIHHNQKRSQASSNVPRDVGLIT